MAPAADDWLVDRLVQPSFAEAIGELLVLAIACDIAADVDVVGRTFPTRFISSKLP